MKKLLLLLFTLAALGFAVGCELESDADADATTANDTGTIDTPTDNTVTYLDHRYVRLDDLSNNQDGEDPGADIDAVILTKGGTGATSYALNSVDYSPGVTAGDNQVPSDATGAPDAFAAYPDTTTCNADEGFVTLGGFGYIILEMGDKMEAGDTITVLEVGGCDYGGSNPAKVETVQVQVSVADSATNPHWQVVGSGQGPAIAFTLDANDLPLVPAN